MARSGWLLALALVVASGCAMPAASEEHARLAKGTSTPLESEDASAVVAAAPSPSPPERAAAPPGEGADPFTASVRPVLAKSCAPCHEPAGKMYDKLPFDDAGVVASHAEGILKRLKGSEKEAVERWLAGLPPERKAASH
jgi:hypothetical protein